MSTDQRSASHDDGRTNAEAASIEHRTSVLFSAFLSRPRDSDVEPTRPHAIAERIAVPTRKMAIWKRPRIRDLGSRENTEANASRGATSLRHTE